MHFGAPSKDGCQDPHRGCFTLADMASRTANFCIDAHDPIAQAHWWAGVLDDFTIDPDGEMNADEAELRGPGGRWLEFLRVPEAKTVKNRMHLCLRPVGTSVDAEVDRIVGLGARVMDDRRGMDDGGWVVLIDPEGNEFCVLGATAEDAGVAQH